MIKLYGIPLSQPFRSVAWAMLMKQCPFQVVVTVPYLANKSFGSQHESYKSKTKARSERIPMIQDDSFYLVESPAILAYLCESRGWMDLYGPPGSHRKALIDSYMHWHHSGTRNIAALVAPYLLPGNYPKLESMDQVQQQSQQLLAQLESSWLQPNHENYIVGDELSIADLLCYEELVQTTMTGVLDLTNYPGIQSWMNRMEQQPYYTEIHAALQTLGSLTEPAKDIPLAKRLQLATKAGLTALETAQSGFALEDKQFLTSSKL